MKGLYVLAVAMLVTISFGVFVAFSEGNSARGQRVFGTCATCHSLQPDQNMTGPSLADLWGRRPEACRASGGTRPLSNQQTSFGTTKLSMNGSKTPSISFRAIR